MISYASYSNPSHTYLPSNSSVIVRNDTLCKNPLVSNEKVYANSRNIEPKQTKPMPIIYSRPLSPISTSQSKAHKFSQESLYSGSFLNVNGRYTLSTPCKASNQTDNVCYSTKLAQKDTYTPLPAHLNATLSSLMPICPVNNVQFNSHRQVYQTEPLDLAPVCNTIKRNSNTLETDVPLQLCPQVTPNKFDENICHKAEKTSLSNPTVGMSIFTETTSIINNPSIISKPFTSTSELNSPYRVLKTKSSISNTSSKLDLTANDVSAPSITISSATPMTTSTDSTTSLSTRNSSPSTPPPVLTPGPYLDMTCGIKTYHHKLKKTWLERHAWAEDLKEASVNIDQSSSNSFSPLDDTPPVLECEVTKKRKQSKSTSENSVSLRTLSDLSPSDSDLEPQSLNNVTNKFKKRKLSNVSPRSENKSATESDRDSDLVVDKKVLPIKIPKKRGRKPKVVTNIPLKKEKNKDDQTRFFQSGPCLNSGPKIHKCRECRLFLSRKKKDPTTQDELDNIFCRFYAFRRLFTNKNGQLMNAGFPDPFNDATSVS